MNNHIPAEDFAAYVDGMLRPEKKNELENHFSGCPACLDELVQIADIMSSRDKIPAEFLTKALGEKSKIAKPVLHLRLVFEVAAAFVVVVFIGYLFLSGNRFWQSDVLPKTSLAGSKSERFPAQAGKGENIAPISQAEADLDAVAKTKNSLPTAGAQSTVSVALKPQTMKKTRTGKSLAYSAAEAEQSRERQEKSRAGAALPTTRQEEKLKDEISQLHTSVAAPQTAKAGQPALADKKQDAALARKEIAGMGALSPCHLEGDVSMSELLNPELLSAWSWFQKGLALELRIDGAGTVTAVVALGKIDPLLARQAENEVRKLLFSASEKKSRRARLIANELPPN